MNPLIQQNDCHLWIFEQTEFLYSLLTHLFLHNELTSYFLIF